MIVRSGEYEIFQHEGEKRVEIWKNKTKVRELTTSKADLKAHGLEKILAFYTAMEDI